jgi:hypothetical protein
MLEGAKATEEADAVDEDVDASALSKNFTRGQLRSARKS